MLSFDNCIIPHNGATIVINVKSFGLSSRILLWRICLSSLNYFQGITILGKFGGISLAFIIDNIKGRCGNRRFLLRRFLLRRFLLRRFLLRRFLLRRFLLRRFLLRRFLLLSHYFFYIFVSNFWWFLFQ
jgi:hypothetical protein